MSITDYESFDRLCTISGITDAYYDIRGVHHIASFEAKQSLLAAMRISVENDADVQQMLRQIRCRNWQNIISPVLVYQKSNATEPVTVILDESQTGHVIHWQVIEENGHRHNGTWQLETQQAVEEHELDGRRLYRFETRLPCVSNIGYHRLKLILADGSSTETLLIATPETCYQPADFESGRKFWGVGLQLYSLRSKRNWGIGDFTDLYSAIKILAPLGIDLVGLNPLHALFPHLPENASPYSPSSRNFLNPIYLDIEAIDDFNRSDKAQQLVNSVEFQARLKSLRDTALVNYTEIWRVKLELLKLLYEQFRKDLFNNESENTKKFRQYQIDGGEALFKFSLFEAMQIFFHQQDESIETWQQWPEEYRDPGSNCVANWAESNTSKMEFCQYLQWHADQQLSAVQENCTQLGMRIGIYNDLAVGDEHFSSQCWAEQSQYAPGVGVGAPPDDFNLLGQNWGLPPLIPQALRDSAYRPFIRTLRANMRNAGALRIDHVMGLMRLYWVPEGYTADQGTYIGYPFEELIGILALESQRNRCLIIGEDLGTVADEVRHQLWLKKVLSYRILFFEKDWHHGTFRSPGEYPQYALCTSGSHDLPTLKGYWQGSDLELREDLNLYPSEDIKNQQQQSREHDRHAIKTALHKEQLISDGALHDEATTELSSELFLSIQRFLARSQSRLMMVQLEDMLSQSYQMNVPGTIDEYPNWRHKISIDLEDWREQTEIETIALAINCERTGKME